MSLLTRVFRRTPSLRQRVAFTSAIAGAIVVVIAGTVVWFGITDAWNERLDRRLDEAAGSRFRSCRGDSTRSRSHPTTRTPLSRCARTVR